MGKTSAHACDRVLSTAMQPWAIDPDMLPSIAAVLAHRLAHDTPLDAVAFEKHAPAGPAPSGVAVIPVYGVIAPRMNLLSDISGGATFEGLTVALNEALADREIGTILFDIDSPGGSVLGATEFAAAVRQAREKKHLIAHAHYQMASAAYWPFASAHEIVGSDSSVVGSIGVYSIHRDLSKALEQHGIKLTYISAGKYKVEGNDTGPLSEDALAHIQGTVNSFYGRFVSDVAKGRGATVEAVKNGYGEGRVLPSDQALAARLIDRVATFEDTLAGVLPSSMTVFATADANPSAPATEATASARLAQARAAQRSLLTLGF
jgi:signal peptide peptidase SppA